MSNENYEFETWEEAKGAIIESWINQIDDIMSNCAHLEFIYPNSQAVKNMIATDDEYTDDVKEDFNYDLDEWVNEIFEAIKPTIEYWLNKLLEDKEIDYTEYVNNFWNEK